MTKKLVSIVVPVYNEESNISWFYDALRKQVSKSPDFDFEVIFIDDGSQDQSSSVIKKIANGKGCRYVQFSRNFGKEAATSAGLAVSRGNAAIMIDVDGQHPLNLIPTLLKEWQAGHEVVIGIREANSKEGFVKRYGSKLHNSLMNSMTSGATVRGATDYRLIDRKVIDEFNKLSERSRITRGLIDWLGFRRTYIGFVAPARHSGEATYTISKLVRLAIYSFTSQTTKPLRATGLLGFLVMIVSLVAGISLLVEKYMFGDPLRLAVSGTGFLAIFLSFLVGLVLTSEGLLAIYIESIHNETQNRPLFIVSDQSK